jgi:release factor glutamine methyltransferase
MSTIEMLTVLEIIKRTTDFFAGKQIESPRLNAELLIGHALGLKRMQLYLQFERPMTESELEKIRPLVRRRAQHEPIQYIIGETEFCGLKLKVDRRALIPRPETELLVEIVVAAAASRTGLRVADLGTGTGAIALALANQLADARVVAVERDPDAAALAAENIGAAGMADRVRLVNASWFDGFGPEERFDIIVSNPPYLTRSETEQAAPEVRNHEPHAALTSPDDGLADLRTLVAQAPRFLAPGGLLALETGIAHHERLRGATADAAFARFESRQDLTGRDRYVLAWVG